MTSTHGADGAGLTDTQIDQARVGELNFARQEGRKGVRVLVGARLSPAKGLARSVVRRRSHASLWGWGVAAGQARPAAGHGWRRQCGQLLVSGSGAASCWGRRRWRHGCCGFARDWRRRAGQTDEAMCGADGCSRTKTMLQTGQTFSSSYQ
jgi:hypothetical protein